MMCVVPMIAKAKDYSRLVPVKKVTADGRERTYWVSPDEQGQQSLFDEQTAGGESETGDRGYFDKLDKDLQQYQVEPLVRALGMIDDKLASRMKAKYENYPYDRDTKELDLKVDFLTADYMHKVLKHPEAAAEYQAEYNEATDRMVKIINNRKKAMTKIKKGSEVQVGEERGTVTDFSRRGFPVVGDEPVFWEEISA